MATVETLTRVLEAVETDLPDSVIRRMLDTAEEDVRAILTTAQRALLPVVLWEGDLAPGAGEILFTSDIAAPTAYPILQFEGMVYADTSFVQYHTQSRLFTAGAAGTGTIVPLTEAGASISLESYTATYDASETRIEFTTQSPAGGVSVTRILGLATAALAPATMRSAVTDLVMLAVLYRGIDSERIGQYTVSPSDHHAERAKVLKRLVFTSDESLVA